MRGATCAAILLLVFTSLEIINVEAQSFQVFPKSTCLPCGGPADFNCSTRTHLNLGGGTFLDGPGSQLWRIKTPDGNVTELYSTNPSSARLLGYEFISQHQHVYTGLRVLNTNSTWNGTTFQCIAYTPSNTTRVNDSAAAVTLKVGGPPSNAFCECECPDANHTSVGSSTDNCKCVTPFPMPTQLPTLSSSPKNTGARNMVGGMIGVIAVLASLCL